MYQGGLITFRFRDRSKLLATPLSNLELEDTDEGIFATRKDTGEKLGYIAEISGIKIEEFMQIFGFEKIDDNK